MGKNDSDQTLVQQQEQLQQEQVQVQQQVQQQEQLQQEPQLRQEQQMEQKESMIDILQRESERFWAQHAAPAEAVQTEQRPQEAGMSRKQRKKLAKQRAKALKEGRKYSSFADEYTAQIHQKYMTYASNSAARYAAFTQAVQANPQEEKADTLHKRIAVAFLPDFKLNKKGRPNSKQDAQIARQAQQQAEDYLYGTQEQKHAVLDKVVQQVCRMHFTNEMFTPSYIRAHFHEMKRLDEKLIIMTNIRGLHAEYFQAMPADTLELWNATQSLANVLSSWIGNTGEISGLDTSCRGMLSAPISEAEFLVVRQEQDADIRAVVHNWQTAMHTYRTNHSEQGEG